MSKVFVHSLKTERYGNANSVIPAGVRGFRDGTGVVVVLPIYGAPNDRKVDFMTTRGFQ